MEECASRVAEVRTQAERTMPQTGRAGQQQIRRELDALQYDHDKYTSQLAETRSALEGVLEALEEYETASEQLRRWLKEMEAQVKDYEFKSTLEEKKTQLEKFKVCHYRLML